MNIINPFYKIRDKESNIFTLRKIEYDNLLPICRQIIEPVREIGFEIIEFNLRGTKISTGEISKSLRQTVSIKIQKGTSIIDLSLVLPKLIDDNFIVINGRRKVPLFQLYDVPIVTRGDHIKLRTNVATIMVVKEKEEPFISITFLGKKVPLSLFMLAYYGLEVLEDKYNLSTFTITDENNMMELLLQDLTTYYRESQGYSQDDFILELGRYYSKYNAKSKGEDVIYAIDLMLKVDPISQKFFHTNTVIDEILYCLVVGEVDDTLYTNKRIRCLEYLLFSKLSKIVFDLCYSNRTARQPKFNINSTQILTECNVSDIVQFDFCINPIEELTKLSRISLLGPGGFKRENIPKHLRDICPTMFGRVCPVDTPDRDNCGVLQNLVPNVKLDGDLKFSNEFLEKQPVSIPVSLVPFLEHDDQTRLQMASSQMRQSILLKKFDNPMIQSGCEGLYTDYTQFIRRAKKNGEVIYIDRKYLMVVYDDNTPDIFNIQYRKIYVEHMDFMSVYVKPGDKFRAGDILAESNFVKGGNIVFGKNLLTGVMIYYGNNYEDGIVISDRLVDEDVLTSVHFKDLSFTIHPSKILLTLDDKKYKPLPEEFEKVDIGNPYAIMKTLNKDDLYSVFSEEHRLEAEKSFIISEVNIFANEWNQDIRQYRDWISKKLEEQNKKDEELQRIIKERMPEDIGKNFIKENGIDLPSFVGKYRNKHEKIEGVYVQMYGVHFRKMKVGDKVANRHGNKGVISRIVPHEKMPQLEDGRHLDICISPLGIISRMNIGQLYEIHLSMSLYDLKENTKKLLNDGATQEDIKGYLTEYVNIIDKTEGNWYLNQFKEQLPDIITEDFINNLTLIQSPFESCKFEDIVKALEYTGTSFKQKIYDPLSKTYLKNGVSVGFLYFLRMVHIAEEKLAARGIGSYAKKTLQPLGGRKNRGGQRLGEMESACLIGHDVPQNLFEFLTTKSDCIDLKNQYIREFIDPNTVDENKKCDIKPESVKLLNSYLTVIGVD